MASVESFDGFARLRQALHEIAAMRGDWAGIPMPLDGSRLVIEPRYPNAAEISQIGVPDESDTSGEIIRNRFFSAKLRSEIVIYERDGKVDWGVIPSFHHLQYDLETLNCSDVWGLEQEQSAIQLLGTLIRPRQMRQYLLTGMFLETSKRSGLAYLFRRLKPTVVIDARGKEMLVRCTLCLHPIGYYAGSWAGAMCPTDEVIAHLMMMRGDEPMFWRRANQHPPHRPEAGL